jgi:hypothetical protein
MPITEDIEITIPETGDTHQVRDVKSVHPDYAELSLQYEFLRDSYTGNGGYETYKAGYDQDGTTLGDWPLKTYLQRYPVEDSEKWQRRLEGAYYPNWIKHIVGIYAGLITREEPSPRGYPQQVDDWMGDADTGWATQRAQIMPWLLVYPTAYILVDKPDSDSTAASAAQASDSEPYAEFIHPDRALDWLYDEAGDLVYFKYETDMDMGDPLTGHTHGKRYTIFTQDGWWYYDIWDGDKSSGETPVIDSGMWPDSIKGTVPVAVYHAGLSNDMTEDVSPIEYIARVMMRLYNVLSQKSATEDGSCFPLFMIPTAGSEDIQKMTWGHSNAITFPMDASNTPAFAGYDVSPVQHMTEEAERLIRQLKDLAAIAIGGDDEGSTGIAKAYAFMKTDVTLAAMVAAIEDVEMQVMSLVARWNNTELEDGATPGYPDKFDLVAAREEIDNANALLEMGFGPQAETAIKQQALSKYMTSTDPETRQAIEDEMEEMASEKQPGAEGCAFESITEEGQQQEELARGSAAQPIQAPVITPR